MKRLPILLFSLICYLLVACTLCSVWVEREMTTQALVVEQHNLGTIIRREATLFYDAEGRHLIEAVEGNGWNDGLQFHELPANDLEEDPNGTVFFHGSESVYQLVYSASRFPTEGERFLPVEEVETLPDSYLCLYPADDNTQSMFIMMEHFGSEKYNPYALPKGMELAAKGDRVLLLETDAGQAPFFEHWAKGLCRSTSLAERIYSLNDAQQLLDALPQLTISALLLLAGLALTATACLARKRWLKAASLLFGITCLCVSVMLLYQIDLPASLMPPETIFDFRHYANELKLICSTMDSLGFPSLSLVAAETASQCKALIVFGGGTLLPVILCECILCQRKAVKG